MSHVKRKLFATTVTILFKYNVHVHLISWYFLSTVCLSIMSWTDNLSSKDCNRLVCEFEPHGNTPDKRQSKTLILSTNVDQTSLETEFLIAICRQTGDKWQWKTLFLKIFYPSLLIVKSVFDCRLSSASMASYFHKRWLSSLAVFS